MYDFEKMARTLQKNYTLQDVFLKSNFQKMLQDLSDSSLIYHGFDPVPIKIYWDRKDDNVAYISDTECVINLDSVLDEGLDFHDRKSCALGKLTHEVFGHGLFTDFSLMKQLSDAESWPYDEFFQSNDKVTIESMKKEYEDNKKSFNSCLFNIINIVEDPTIEYLALTVYPGFKPHVDFLTQRLKIYLSDKPEMYSKGSFVPPDDYQVVNTLFLKQARGMDVSDYYDKYPELKETEKIFSDLSAMPTYKDRLKAACYAFELFWKYIQPVLGTEDIEEALKEILKDFKQNNKNQRTENGQMNNSKAQSKGALTQTQAKSNKSTECKNDERSDENTEGSSDVEGDHRHSGQRMQNNHQEGSEVKKADGDPLNSSNEKDNGNPTDNESGTDQLDDKNSTTELVDEIMNKSLFGLIKEIAASMDKESLEKTCENLELSQLVNNQGIKLGDTSFAIYPSAKQNISEYNHEFNSEMKRISKTLSKKVLETLKIRRKGNVQYNLEEGQFIDLESIANGSNKVFMDINLPNKIPLCSVEIMIDMSGSMHGEKARAAMKTALVLEAFCRELKIPIDIFGHYYFGGSGTSIFKFKSFNEPANVSTATRLLGIQNANGCNHDGVAFLYGLKKLVDRKEPVKIYFILSDGQPNANNFGTTAYKAVLSKSKATVKKHNISVVPIAVDVYSLSTLADIYGTIVDGTDLNKLPQKITSILLKKIKKSI